MIGADDALPTFIGNHYAPYNSSIATSASTSSVSVWSDASSQSSDDSATSVSDSDSCDSFCPRQKEVPSLRRPTLHQRLPPLVTDALPSEQRQNPRRTSAACQGRPARLPSLVRQSDRKLNFVDNLVDSSAQIVEAIWPLSSVVCRSELGNKAVLPLRTFIQETLRRSRTSFSTLQVALYYLILIKPHVPQHNFTTEQPEDCHTDRALQCGRRMFLAALILASKYLQDRNYSARAWSKISGLNTQEINQNEIAFLLAVNWEIHIADDVFKRWTEVILNKAPPPMPPSPGGLTSPTTQQTANWKRIILGLDPKLTNVDQLLSPQSTAPKLSDLTAFSPRSILNAPQDFGYGGRTPTDVIPCAPAILEPSPATTYNAGIAAPVLGHLPTPRLTPQSSGLCTPAASAATQMLVRSSMCSAIAQAGQVTSNQILDRVPTSSSTSPLSYCPLRRSSLATSISTASSPESMVSDLSRTSRSSSISSASSLASATLNNKLGLSSRRVPRLSYDRRGIKPSVPSVPEIFGEQPFTSSPESYSGPIGSRDMYSEGDDYKVGSKRTLPASFDLQDNVRHLLRERPVSPEGWPSTFAPPRSTSSTYLQVPMRSDLPGSRKRLCCSAEAASTFRSESQRSMWDGILN